MAESESEIHVNEEERKKIYLSRHARFARVSCCRGGIALVVGSRKQVGGLSPWRLGGLDPDETY